jgi:hypothetical protein
MNCRVSIAKHGAVFWSSRWVSPEHAEVIRQKNQRLIDANRWDHVITIETQLTREEQLEAARNLEPDDCTIAAVGGARRCSSCGRPGGGHEVDCLKVRRMESEKLQAACDHRAEYGTTRTTGDPPGAPCCGRCGLELPMDRQEASP